MKLKKKIPLIDQHDKLGFWGGKFGGSYIPETLKKPVDDLTKEFKKLRKNKKFLKKRDLYFKNYIGSPTRFIKLENLSKHIGGAQIWAKVVSDANGGAHKIYNATVHALICKSMGKKYIVGDTGAGYAGKMLSMAAKKFGLKCKIFMGAKDIKRQKPNCDAMRKNGAEIVPVTTGSQTLVDAVSECMRYWVSNCDTTHMCVGSTVGPNIFVKICGWSTAQISRELKKQIKEQFIEAYKGITFPFILFNNMEISSILPSKLIKRATNCPAICKGSISSPPCDNLKAFRNNINDLSLLLHSNAMFASLINSFAGPIFALSNNHLNSNMRFFAFFPKSPMHKCLIPCLRAY